MLLLVSALKLIAEIGLLACLGRGLLGLLIGIISDLMYVWIDPRIDFARRG